MALAGCVLSSFGTVTVTWNNGDVSKTCKPGTTTELKEHDKTYTISGYNTKDDRTVISVRTRCTLILDGLNLDNNLCAGVSSLRIESGEVRLFVKGKNVVSSGSGAAGIFVAQEATLTIDSATDGSSVGELVAVCGHNGTAIGGYGPFNSFPKANCGKIVINGARITTEHKYANPFRWSGGLGIPYDVSRGKVEINGGTLLLKNPYSICGEEPVAINGGCVRCACDKGQGSGIYKVRTPGSDAGIEHCTPRNAMLNRPVYPVELELPDVDMTGMRIEGLDERIGLKDVMPLEGTKQGTQSLFLYLPLVDRSLRIVTPFYSVQYDLKAGNDGLSVVRRTVRRMETSVRFDGQLTVDGVPQRGKRATFSVKADGDATEQVTFTTDTNGFFAAALPAGTKAGAKVSLSGVQVEGGEPISLSHDMTVPVVPYALAADGASEEVVVENGRFGVVDTSVTVTKDLTVTDLKVNKNLSVAGSIQASQVLTSSHSDLVDTKLIGEPGERGRLHWFGTEQKLLTAKLSSTVTPYAVYRSKSPCCQWSAELVKDGTVPRPIQGGNSHMEYKCMAPSGHFTLKAESEDTPIDDPYEKPAHVWWGRPAVEFPISRDGFLTARIHAEKFGAVMFTLDILEEGNPSWWHYFKIGSHVVWGGLNTPSPRLLDRDYTIAVRKGDVIHMRLLWYSALNPQYGRGDGVPVESKLDVEVAFRPFGLAD